MSEKRKERMDFQKVKDEAEVERVLDPLGILKHLERKGDQLVGWCPLGDEHGRADSFSCSPRKKVFQCFACKARGSILDFVRALERIDLRTAARLVSEIMDKPANGVPLQKRNGRPYATSFAPDRKRPAARASKRMPAIVKKTMY
jgi:DNA primase